MTRLYFLQRAVLASLHHWTKNVPTKTHKPFPCICYKARLTPGPKDVGCRVCNLDWKCSLEVFVLQWEVGPSWEILRSLGRCPGGRWWDPDSSFYFQTQSFLLMRWMNQISTSFYWDVLSCYRPKAMGPNDPFLFMSWWSQLFIIARKSWQTCGLWAKPDTVPVLME